LASQWQNLSLLKKKQQTVWDVSSNTTVLEQTSTPQPQPQLEPPGRVSPVVDKQQQRFASILAKNGVQRDPYTPLQFDTHFAQEEKAPIGIYFKQNQLNTWPKLAYVKHGTVGSADNFRYLADTIPDLRAGCTLLSINGHQLDHYSEQEAKQLLKTRPLTLTWAEPIIKAHFSRQGPLGIAFVPGVERRCLGLAHTEAAAAAASSSTSTLASTWWSVA
jgi:hypothetical protein